ncbi:hypothetical protein [Scytonema sp. NUACC21]
MQKETQFKEPGLLAFINRLGLLYSQISETQPAKKQRAGNAIAGIFSSVHRRK